MRAAVDLVEEHGTAAISITDIADAADVSRQVLYQQFGDRDALLLEAAFDLVRNDLLTALEEAPGEPGLDRATMLMSVRHFAEHRVFYRALLTSASSYALIDGLSTLSCRFTGKRCSTRMEHSPVRAFSKTWPHSPPAEWPP